MAGQRANREDFRILDQYIAEEQASPPVPPTDFVTSGSNAEMPLLAAFEAIGSGFALGEERKAELAKCSIAELLTHVRLNRAALSPEDLHLIHDLAIERLLQRDEATAGEAGELSRIVMQEAVSRIV